MTTFDKASLNKLKNFAWKV